MKEDVYKRQMLYGLILIFLSGVNYILLDSNATNIINITMLMSTFIIVIGLSLIHI